MATIIPGTLAIESDFALLEYIKNNYKNNVHKISIEGMLHSKQYNILSSML